MAELDYYSVMKSRIEYFEKKYDSYDSFPAKVELIPEKISKQKRQKIRQKISEGYSSIISLFF